MRPARALSALLALVVCAWFILGYRQASSLGRAEAIINAQNQTTAARARTAIALLDEAGTLNPDRQVAIDRVHILLERGEDAQAMRIILGVTRAEPQNIQAWLWLAHASDGREPLFSYALHRARELEPLVP